MSFHSVTLNFIKKKNYCKRALSLTEITTRNVLYRVRHLTFFSTSVYCSCLIWQIISFILPWNEYGCAYAWTMLGSGPAINLHKMPILGKKIIFSYEAHFDCRKQAKFSHVEHLHAYIEKTTHPKQDTVWFWGIIGPFFFENEQGEAVTVKGDRYRAMLNEFLFTKI